MLAAAAWPEAGTAAQTPGNRPAPATRIVSLVPALTEMLFAIGAGPQVVGVSSFDEFPPEVKQLPRVGALLNPDTERILSLRPDLVIVYGSQTDQQTQMERAGIRTYSYRHGGISTVLTTIRELGVVTGREREAADLAGRIEARLAAVRARVRGQARPRVLLVIDRQPGTLRGMYVSGGRGFMQELLEAAGGTNVFGDIDRESVQPSQETLITRPADVILEVRATGPQVSAEAERRVWAPLASYPAVRTGRIQLLTGSYLVVPGPRIADAADAFAKALHPVVTTEN